MIKILFKKKRAFSLIELLLVLTIFLVMATSSGIFYSRFILQGAVSTAVKEISGSLNKARMQSIAGKQNSAWGVNIFNNKVYVFLGNSFASRTQAFDETLDLNPNLLITGFSEVFFTKGTGIPSTNLTIVISAGGNSKTISVNSEGTVNQ
jgi:prepilin-type N-terminal cleavage/methylation domain-containing protein